VIVGVCAGETQRFNDDGNISELALVSQAALPVGYGA
jgi:hypothetical protein